MIGHEITALYGLDHAQTLALIYPGIIRHFRERKKQKLLQYALRVWGLADGDENARIDAAIEKTDEFFRSLGVGTRLADYNIPAQAGKLVAERLAKRGRPLGERGDVKPERRGGHYCPAHMINSTRRHGEHGVKINYNIK